MIAIPDIEKPKKVDGIKIDFHFEDGHFETYIIDIEEIIDIVTCEECKYGILEDDDDIYQCEYNGSAWNEGNHSCSYGERRSK